jgi:transcriptional regulator with XRE-family HTH domain
VVFEDTQRPSEVFRRRIRGRREVRGLTQEDLAKKMTAAGVPLTGDKISKIETGARAVEYDEQFAFAYVLGVPLAQLMRPRNGELPIRAGGIGLERHEVGNWLVWGSPRSRESMTAQTLMGLTRQIATMVQVLADERGHPRRQAYRKTLAAVLQRLSKAARIRI